LAGWIHLLAHPAHQVKIYANKSQSVSLRGFFANKFQVNSMSKNFTPFRRHRPPAQRVAWIFPPWAGKNKDTAVPYSVRVYSGAKHPLKNTQSIRNRKNSINFQLCDGQ
jgi:hypothetical protein